MHQLDALDNIMIEGEIPDIPLHMSAAMIYDISGGLDSVELAEALQANFTTLVEEYFPILRCRVEKLPLHLDKAWWVETDEFDPTYHYAREGLPPPADWGAFYQILARFHAEPLDHSKPLWQVLIVEGLDGLEGIPEGSLALLVKIHHAVMDGKSAVRLFAGLHSLSPEPDAECIAASLPPLDSQESDYRPPHWWIKYGRAWWHSIERPIDMASTVWKSLPQLWQSESEAEAELTIPRVSFNHAITPDRVVGHLRLDIDLLRRLERKYNCTINDLALCIVSGAQRLYLSENNELPTESLVAAMPIDVRHAETDGNTGNKVQLARVSLHSDMAGVADRLRAIHADTSRVKKRSREHESADMMAILDEVHPAIVLWLGEWLVTTGLIDKLPQPANVVVSNVPGIDVDTWLMGAKLVDYIGMGPLGPNVGLFHTISSTPGHINISFVGTRKFMGDGAKYRDALRRSYEEMRAALC